MDPTNAVPVITNTMPAMVSHHWPAVTVAAMWIVREAHIWWPSICSAWPYITSHGGVFGIAKAFFVGTPQPEPAATPAAQPKIP